MRWRAGSGRQAGTTARRRRYAVMAAVALSACSPRPDSGPVVVSAIEGRPGYADPSRYRLSTPSRLLIDATAQGLVHFDAAGQIEPGLAERWTVIDDGMTYIFRLREASWSDGAPVTADEVVAILRRQIAPGSRNPLAPFLTAIESVVVMTPQVIEITLKRPRPDLLKLFAQPELGLLRREPFGGTGPMRIYRGGRVPLLRPAGDITRADPDDTRPLRPEETVRLIGERAARAIARFAAHDSDLVTGGSFTDWPLLAYAGVAPANIRVDPAAGLFGLAIVRRDGFLAEPGNRGAIAEALDRTQVTAAIAASWTPIETILPETLDSAAPPAIPGWSTAPLADRLIDARARVTAWPGGPVSLRIALPAGPGATILYGAVAASLTRIGIASQRVAMDAPADLKLIDMVAPYDSARWYLATACQLCSDAAAGAIELAREAPTLPDRAARLAAADVALTQDIAFVPLARPLRWSLVALRLGQWQANPRAWHPLNHLRANPN